MNTSKYSTYSKTARFSLLIPTIVFLLSACSNSESNKTFEWKLQSQAVESSVDYQQLIVMADKVRVMSGGRLDITAYPGGAKSLASGPDIFNAVRQGTVQMGNGWPNWWSAQDPAWAVMNAGPFDLMNIDASMIFFFEEQGIKLANQLSEPEGIMWRPAWWPGMEFGLLSREPISGLDDLENKKVRIGPGLPSEVLAEAASAFTIPLTPDEIRPALESGELDAVEWTTAGGAWELGLNDISPFAIVPAIWQPSVVSDFLINKEAFEQLPDDLKEILETAIHSYTLTTTLKSKKKDIEAYEKFLSSDTKITKWSKDDIERWRAASKKIEALYKSRNQFTRDLVDRKQAFKKRYEAYYEVFGPYDQ